MSTLIYRTLDTNVLVSGIFFAGPPYEILKAWRDGKINLVISTAILEEYQRVAEKLAQEFSGVDVSRILDLLTVGSEIVHAPPLQEPVCSDPEDDKFLACAIAGSAKYVVTGDKQLLKVSRYGNVEITNPRWFVESQLAS
jgi:putative PIN family toxin of toxin-antitoxin system